MSKKIVSDMVIWAALAEPHLLGAALHVAQSRWPCMSDSWRPRGLHDEGSVIMILGSGRASGNEPNWSLTALTTKTPQQQHNNYICQKHSITDA